MMVETSMLADFIAESNLANVVSVGVDLVDIARIKSATVRTASFSHRVFTNRELAANNSVSTLAGKFAAKEAVLKCLKAPLFALSFSEIEILNQDSGAPYVELSGKAASWAEKSSISNILVSISHSDEQAIAVACAIS